MSKSDLPDDYVPALRFSWLTAIYDPVVRWTTRESTVKNALIEQAELKEGMSVLDLASGTGTLAIIIKRKFPGIDVVGVDGDAKILQIGVLGIFPRKQTKSSRAAAISGLPGGITFPEPVNIPRLST
ncbi:hypothetical protein R50073_50770 (plasmid) [Maricurvus nonylphenolicus]|jgi:SAM-dependent methyltransferase|uniref:class I SAM-dependent methyltransferase n=1 Tax=Maricurvus nonylphenolicus TaxID=1008307 RepID=UPI0036F3069A